MLSELLATTAGSLAFLDYMRNWRLEEIGLFCNPKIVFQNDQPLRPYQRRDHAKQLFLVQEGICNFYLREAIMVGAPKRPAGWSSGEYFSSRSYLEDLPTLDRAYADDREGLQRLFQRAAGSLQEGDLFYFAVSRHGSFVKPRNVFLKMLRLGDKALADFYALTEEQRAARLTADGVMTNSAIVGKPGDYQVSVDEFEELFEPVASSGSVNVLYFDTCFGGDFARRLGKGNTTTITSTRPGKFLTMPPPNQNLLTGEWEDQSIPHHSPTRNSFEYRFYQGADVRSAFMGSTDRLRWMMFDSLFLPIRPIINHPRMYVGNIDPTTVRLQ